jgi:hypothetical protein
LGALLAVVSFAICVNCGGDPNAFRNEQTIFVADAHRDDGKRFIVRADEKLTTFVELKAAIC